MHLKGASQREEDLKEKYYRTCDVYSLLLPYLILRIIFKELVGKQFRLNAFVYFRNCSCFKLQPRGHVCPVFPCFHLELCHSEFRFYTFFSSIGTVSRKYTSLPRH